MQKNTIRLKGLESVWELVEAWLELPEERELFARLVDKEQQKTVTVISEQMTKGVIQTLDAFDKIAEMYKRLGYPVDQIQQIMGPRIESTVNVFNKLSYVKQLKKRGTIVQSVVKVADQFERRKERRFETRPEIYFKVLEQWHKGYVCDISNTGAQVLTDHALNPNDRTTIRLRDLTNCQDVNVDGTVIWHRNAQAENYSSRFGLHFKEMLPVPASCFVPERISN